MSRYAISAIFICLELVLFLFLVFGNIDSFLIFLFIAAVVDIPAFLSLINKNANPEYKVPWVFIISALPIAGAVIYFLFYTRRMSRSETRLLVGIFKMLKSERCPENYITALCERDTLAYGKANALLNDYPLAEVYSDSSAKLFSCGEEYFESLINDISSAKNYIFLEYFIIDEGSLWDEIHAILVKKAAEGVDVRLIYDDIGCMKTLPPRYERTLRREGIKTYRFNKVSPRISPIHHNRDHRKICIVDGKFAYTGGVNIADEYVNRVSRFGYWKDGGIRLSGMAVRGFVKMFLSAFDTVSGTVSDYEGILSLTEKEKESDGGFYIPFASGPAPTYKRPAGKNAFLNLINQAERYVYITTPYLIIDYELTEALCNASLRGVDVRIITPGVPDKKIVKVMTKSAYPYLIDAGVRIYEYQPGFIHEKTFISDDKYLVVGTINFDYRSLVHHYEDAVWAYNSGVTEHAREQFLKTLEDSKKMTKRSSRLTPSEWFFKNIIRIFAPLL
ncbi:MAG: PLDc N-terminal domain-containing protein [Clostridia bacterium]|nr:PLDc N-terminal domain-containing protein [Clostridia bacterium]